MKKSWLKKKSLPTKERKGKLNLQTNKNSKKIILKMKNGQQLNEMSLVGRD